MSDGDFEVVGVLLAPVAIGGGGSCLTVIGVIMFFVAIATGLAIDSVVHHSAISTGITLVLCCSAPGILGGAIGIGLAAISKR